MRRLTAVLTLAVVAGACAGDAAGPGGDTTAALLDEMAGIAYGATRVGDPRIDFMTRLGQLPAELALSAEQSARINALVADFLAATAADRDALADIMNQATEARRAGKTRDEVRAILAGAADIRSRLQQAERALREAVMGVLTPAQRAWLTGRTAPEPRPCSTVTDAQRNEISALLAAYEQANAADIELVRSAQERARAAKQAGAPRAEVAAILAEARAALQRLAAARAALLSAINAVLTAEQQAAGCFRGGGGSRK